MAGLTDLISGLFNTIGDQAVKVRTAVTGKDPAIEGQVEILQQQIEAAKQQAIAASDAAQSDYWKATLGVTGSNFFKFFVAGPKPALFWVCVLAFALQYVFQPIGNWILTLTAATYRLSAIDMSMPTQILVAGMGVASVVVRGVEKLNSVQNNH